MHPFKTPLYIFVLGSLFITLLDTLFFYLAPVNPFLGMNHFFLLILILLMFLPITRQKLQDNEMQKIPFWSWVSHVITIQAGFVFLFFSLCAQLIYIQELITPSETIDLTPIARQFTALSMDFLPWTIVTLFSVILGYFSLCENKQSNIAITLSPLLRHHTPTRVGAMFDLFTRQGISGTVSISLSIFLLGAVEFTSQCFGTSIFKAFSLLDVFGLWALGLFFYSKRWQSILGYFITRRTSIGTLYLLYTLIIAVGLPCLIILLGFIFKPMADLFSPLGLHSHHILKDLFIGKEWPWFLFAFFIGWTPILGSAIVRLSRGYRIWQMICVSMLFPVLIFISARFQNADLIVGILTFLKTHMFVSLFPIVLFYYFFKDIPHLNHLFYGYVHKQSIEKYRSPLKYLKVFPALLLYSIFMIVGLGYKFFMFVNLIYSLVIFLIFNLMLFSFGVRVATPRGQV